MKITYTITEEERRGRTMFVLKDSTGQEESYFSKQSAEDARKLWAFEHKHREKSYSGTVKERAGIVCGFILNFDGGHGSRVFDNCGEMGDGEKVFHEVLKRAQKDPDLLRKIKTNNDGKWFASLVETDNRHFIKPVFPLSVLADKKRHTLYTQGPWTITATRKADNRCGLTVIYKNYRTKEGCTWFFTPAEFHKLQGGNFPRHVRHHAFLITQDRGRKNATWSDVLSSGVI